MTPLAARYFRTGADENARIILAGAQFFECSAIYEMSKEMVAADLEAGAVEYSEMAHLPAPLSVVEFVFGFGRVMLLAEQKDDLIKYMMFGALISDEINFVMECGFRLGTGENLNASWDERVLQRWSGLSGMEPKLFADQQATGVNGILEKMMCIINQPGLVEQRLRETDRRVLRLATKSERTRSAADHWHECRIRPGKHGVVDEGSQNGPERQLHYVRKHFKPSLSRWIDGYWRGNADLGIHLKWYSPQPLFKGGVA